MDNVVDLKARRKSATVTRIPISCPNTVDSKLEQTRELAKRAAEVRLQFRDFAMAAIAADEIDWAMRVIEAEAREVLTGLREARDK